MNEHTFIVFCTPNSPEANFGSSLRHITEHPVPERWSVCPQILIFCTWSGQFANRRAAKASNLISTMHEIPCIHPYFTHLLSIHKKHQLIISKLYTKYIEISGDLYLHNFSVLWELLAAYLGELRTPRGPSCYSQNVLINSKKRTWLGRPNKATTSTNIDLNLLPLATPTSAHCSA